MISFSSSLGAQFFFLKLGFWLYSCFSKKWFLGIKVTYYILPKMLKNSIYCYFSHPLKTKYIVAWHRHSTMSNCYTKMLRGRQSCFLDLTQTFLMVNCKLSKMKAENPGCLLIDLLAIISLFQWLYQFKFFSI